MLHLGGGELAIDVRRRTGIAMVHDQLHSLDLPMHPRQGDGCFCTPWPLGDGDHRTGEPQRADEE
jgi:hypothetical protein